MKERQVRVLINKETYCLREDVKDIRKEIQEMRGQLGYGYHSPYTESEEEKIIYNKSNFGFPRICLYDQLQALLKHFGLEIKKVAREEHIKVISKRRMRPSRKAQQPKA